MSGLLSGLLSLGRRDTSAPMEYETAKQQAAHSDVKVRRKLARRANVQPEILYYLAADAEEGVRREIASNPSSPVQADAILAGDSDDTVRAQIAAKVARLAPGLTGDQRAKAGDIVAEILETLAQDQTVKVRSALAAELKAARDVPISVIEKLARDVEIGISGPVLRNSPLLSDAFLIEIIASPPVRDALKHVAARRDLSADVADAIVEADEPDAISSLLRNKSAQIREDTLDSLVERAADVDDWHEPLVERPSLSVRSATALSRFVADTLVDKLLGRADLDPAVSAEIGRNVRRKLGAGAEPADDEVRETAGERALRLFKAGHLGETEILNAIAGNERTFIFEALALLGEYRPSVAQKAFSLASAKGVVSVCWKAGVTADTALQLQLKVARIAPGDVLKPARGDYAMSEKDMNWQLEFLGA